jgi:ActR/RegA family two-component response regulator
MGLIGRLEDLPIADIVHIVSLSRGTGILDLRLSQGHHTVIFRKGLMVAASSPLISSLRVDLEGRLNAGPLRRLLDPEKPVGVSALEKHLIAPLDLGKIVFQRVATVIRGLTETRSGEFEFLSREPSLDEMEYEPHAVFKRGGIRPEDILGKRAEGLRALVSVKQSLKSAAERSAETRVKTNPTPVAKVPDRCLVVLENDAATCEAIRHASSIHGIAMIEARSPANVVGMLDQPLFMVAVVGLGADPELAVFPLIRDMKRCRPQLPIVVLDDTSDFRRRHRALDAGADVYMRKPAEGANEERSVFAEDLLLFVTRRIGERKPDTAEQSIYRGFRLLVQLLEEVSTPGDLSQLSLTILQLAADYVDRGVLYARKGQQFITLGKFGVRGNGCSPHVSVFDQVVATGRPFRGAVNESVVAELESAFGAANVREAIVLPLLCGGEVVGILYGDNGVNPRPIDDTLGLEVFLSEAGFAFQNILGEGHSLAERLSIREIQHA